jgi:hypothetical protein
MAVPLRKLLFLLRESGLVTDEQLTELRDRAMRTGAADAVRAFADVNQVVAEFRAGRCNVRRLADAHANLLGALERNGEEVRSAASQLKALYRSVVGPKRKAKRRGSKAAP